MEQNELIRDCIKGKRLAQQELYDLYAAPMLGICYRYTKNLDDAEDILQEGFVKVFNNLQQFKNKGDLGAWIRRIVVNTTLTYLKKHTRYRNQLDFEQTPLHPIVQEDANMHLQTAELIELIRQLPTGYQTIFNLVAIEGFNHLEVSAMLGINENTSRSQYSRARAILIREIENQEQIQSSSKCS